MSISLDDAVALVEGSTLFDERWYADLVGAAFGSREEAVRHWVEHAVGAPHPLFEPLWLYPRSRWRRSAPDPLSFYLSRLAEQARSPHPLVDITATGPIAGWLTEHEPGALLGPALPRLPVGKVSIQLAVGDLPRAVRWMRHLQEHSPDVPVAVITGDLDEQRLLGAVARALPVIRVVATEPSATDVVVRVGASVRPPRGGWLPALLATLERSDAAAAQPLLLGPDGTVASPVVVGHPAADAQRIGRLPLPRGPMPAVLATRTGIAGDLVLAADSVLILQDPTSSLRHRDDDDRTRAVWRAAGFESPHGRPLTVREGRPALRWTIDIAAPPTGERWGDTHFARSLAGALERLGQWVAIDHPESRGRATRDLENVTLTIRGLERVEPQAGQTNLLWVISHPELVTPEEVARYDAAYSASLTWAADRSRAWGTTIEPLLQCTDAARFHPELAEPDTGPRHLFVGSSRGVLRSSVREALAAGLPLTVYGGGWDGWSETAGAFVPNEELGGLYASAGLVLGDHWEDMRANGFVSNRVFDVLATGARLLCDDVTGLCEALGPEVGSAVRVWRDAEDFRRLTAEPFEHHWPDATERRRTAERVVAEHSFDARARTLLDTVLGLRVGS